MKCRDDGLDNDMQHSPPRLKASDNELRCKLIELYLNHICRSSSIDVPLVVKPTVLGGFKDLFVPPIPLREGESLEDRWRMEQEALGSALKMVKENQEYGMRKPLMEKMQEIADKMNDTQPTDDCGPKYVNDAAQIEFSMREPPRKRGDVLPVTKEWLLSLSGAEFITAAQSVRFPVGPWGFIQFAFGESDSITDSFVSNGVNSMVEISVPQSRTEALQLLKDWDVTMGISRKNMESKGYKVLPVREEAHKKIVSVAVKEATRQIPDCWVERLIEFTPAIICLAISMILVACVAVAVAAFALEGK